MSGPFAAVFTPFTEQGVLCLDKIPLIVEYLYSSGLSGAFVCGTTGESMSLSKNERMEIIKAFMSIPVCKNQKFKIIFHVGSASFHESRELAIYGEQLKCFAISCMPPFFFKPSSIDDLIQNLSFVANGCPNTPFIYYHFPTITNVNFKAFPIVSSAILKIPNFSGIKFTDNDMYDLGLIMDLKKYEKQDLNLFFGWDQAAICCLSLGIEGAIGSSYNCLPKLVVDLFSQINTSNLKTARNIQEKIRKFFKIINKGHWLTMQKQAFIFLTGIDVGPVRQPLLNLTNEIKMELKNQLISNGFMN